MEFEWDEAKRLSNIRKHGIDFAEITSIFDGEIIINEDTSSFYGEPRYILRDSIFYSFDSCLY
jgi:uncharacterized protein